MGWARPLAIDDFVKVIGGADVGGLQTMSPAVLGLICAEIAKISPSDLGYGLKSGAHSTDWGGR